eukprot:475615-Pleurochrysis_carterae.AAC.1
MVGPYDYDSRLEASLYSLASYHCLMLVGWITIFNCYFARPTTYDDIISGGRRNGINSLMILTRRVRADRPTPQYGLLAIKACLGLLAMNACDGSS